MKNLMITGGCGFIGGNFIRYNIDNYNKIFNVDIQTYAATHNFLNTGKYCCIKKDINHITAEDLIGLDIDIILHMAAESHVDNSIIDPTPFLTTNINGTVNLLKCVAEVKNRIGKSIRFHHVSTDEVFGSLELTDDRRFDEQSIYSPNNPYSASKAASDHFVRAFGNTYGIEYTISNCSNNYGPYQHSEKLIPTIIRNLIKESPIPIYGDGLNVRDWIYVKDHCRAIQMILNNGKIAETYCVGGNCEYTNKELCEKICQLYYNMTGYHYQIEYVKDRLGHDKRYAIDGTKILNTLGFEPSTTLHDGLTATLEHYLQRKDK